mgnify:CR=1 FL=1
MMNTGSGHGWRGLSGGHVVDSIDPLGHKAGRFALYQHARTILVNTRRRRTRRRRRRNEEEEEEEEKEEEEEEEERSGRKNAHSVSGQAPKQQRTEAVKRKTLGRLV